MKMGRRMLLAVLSAVVALAVKAQDTTFVIKGVAPEGAQYVYLYVSGERGIVDSALVSNGRFELSGRRALNAGLTVADKMEGWTLFNDGTPVELNMRNLKVSASPLNERMFVEYRKLKGIEDKGEALYKEYEKAVADHSDAGRASQKRLAGEFAKLQDSAIVLHLDVIRRNHDNLIPAVFISSISRALDYQTLKEVLDPSAPYYSHPLLAGARAMLEMSEASLGKRKPGLAFTDIDMADTAGRMRKLGEWCGKGNYVLVDFWASWCGPCRMEMPNVVENYKKYHSKGFEIVGISFDQNAESWKKAIEQMGMEWPQLSDLKGWNSAAASTYSVKSIPASMLVDGQGRIVAVDLRGPMLGKKLKEIYGF